MQMMQKKIFNWTLRSIAALAVLGFSGHALAAPDVLYPASATAKVNNAAVTFTSFAFNAGSGNGNGAAGDGNATLPAINVGDAVEVAVTWRVQDRANNGNSSSNTTYPRSQVTFNISQPDGQSLVIPAIPVCEVENKGDSCPTLITFAPDSAGPYVVEVTSVDVGPNDGTRKKINGTKFVLNFTANVVAPEKVDTTLAVDQLCVAYRALQANASATLIADTEPTSLVVGGDVDFYIDPTLENGSATSQKLGTGTTDNGGVATLGFDPSSLAVGDYVLYGEYGGDDLYNGSNDSDTLGVYYVFGGFRQPINAEGNSVFGGRVIPVKIVIKDAAGVIVTDAQPQVWIVDVDGVTDLGEVSEATSVSSADSGNIMRFSASEQQYIYNLDVSSLPNGVFKIRVNLGGSTVCGPQGHDVLVTILRKGGKK